MCAKLARGVVLGPVLRWLRGLRFPWLFAVTVLLLLLDLAIPDIIPFADEILLGLIATLLGMLRRRWSGGDPGKGAGGARRSSVG
ncbi:MAG: hypothetical protein PVF68_13995 [Acidobacteriota bacterium]|jgi:hypothetical protein